MQTLSFQRLNEGWNAQPNAPNAHVHAHAISALTLATAGRIKEAQAERGRISALRPDYNFRQFKGAFHLLDDLKDIYQRAAKLVQISE